VKYKARRGSLSLGKRPMNNEIVHDDKWNRKLPFFDYILKGGDRGAL